MNWLTKIAAFKVLSALPGGSALYRFSQEQFTKSLVPTRERVAQKTGVGLRYYQWLEENNCGAQLVGGTHLDFGTGWQPTIPLLYYSLGVDRQILFDIVPVLNGELVASTQKTFCALAQAPDCPFRNKLRRLPEIPPAHRGSLMALEKMGIHYFAPYQRKLDELDGAIDVVTCTQVFLHIDKAVLLQIFRGLHRSIKKGGKFLATIHLYDLYTNSDRGISQYNHLKYSPQVWNSWINSSLMSYNRLRAPDYRELLTAAGFAIRHFEVEKPAADDLKQLERIRKDSSFSKYSPEDLGAKHLFFVAEKL